MRLLPALMLLLLLVPGVVAQDPKPPAPFDFAKERLKAWEYLADKHADLGDDYKKAKVFTEARKQYDRARELVADLPRAMKGLGFEKQRGEWVQKEILPPKDEGTPAQVAEARKKPDDGKLKDYTRCADRCRKLLDATRKAGTELEQRQAASDLLYYAPDDAEARKLRGHIKDGDDWLPDFAKTWRDQGRKLMEKGSFGDVLEGEDEQAKLIGATFWRRQSELLVVRTSVDETRAKMMHRAVQVNTQRAMELLAIKEFPFGPGRKYTLTQVNTTEQWEAMLTKVLKLEGDTLEFNRKLAGTYTREPVGFMTRASVDASADDMIGNSTVIQILVNHRGKGGDNPPWLTTGWGYLVTSQALGTTQTLRYTLDTQGQTSSSRNIIPEFSKKGGTPELLREVALHDVTFSKDMPLAALLLLKVNDIDQSAAAKSFSLMEFLFQSYSDQTRKWLSAAPAADKERVQELEQAFGKPLADLETEWRQWVLARY